MEAKSEEKNVISLDCDKELDSPKSGNYSSPRKKLQQVKIQAKAMADEV